MKKKTAGKKEKCKSHSQSRKPSAEAQREIKRNLAMNELTEKMNVKFRKEMIHYIESHNMDQKDISVKLSEDQSTISKFISGTKWGIPKLAVKARLMGFNFEKEYAMCLAIYDDNFSEYMAQKEDRKKKKEEDE